MTGTATAQSIWTDLNVEVDDYKRAQIHLAWRGLKTESGEARNELVFGLVELLPAEFPEPTPEPLQSLSLHAGREGKLCVGRAPAPAAEAAAWFRDASARQPRFPPEPDGSYKPHKLYVDAQLWEPDWPSLNTLWHERSTSAPYVPAAHDCPRAIHRLCSRRVVLDDLDGTTRRAAYDFLSSELGFSFDQFPELLGSLHLLLPNPVHRAPRVRYEPEERKLLLQIPPRPGRSLNGLQLFVRNERPTGASSLQQCPLGKEFTEVSFQEQMDHVALDIVCPTRGLLFTQPPTTWIASVQLAAHMIGQRRQVKLDEDGDEFVVDVGTSETSRTGEPPEEDARGLMRTGSASRKLRREKQRYRQQVFVQDRDQATEFVRAAVGSARGTLTVVDPYFGARDLYEFVLATREMNLPVRVLTSIMHVRRRSEDGTRPAEILADALGRLQGKSGVGPIEVRAMGNTATPAIHDRFVVADDDCWLLGSSLNSLGTAGTVCLRAPDPEPIIAMIDAEFARSSTLQHWIATHSLVQPSVLQPPALASRVRSALRSCWEVVRPQGKR